MVVEQSAELLLHVADLAVVEPLQLIYGQLFLLGHLFRGQLDLEPKLGIALQESVLGLLRPLVKCALEGGYGCCYVEFIHYCLPHFDGLDQVAVEVGVAVEDLKIAAHLLAHRVCCAELGIVPRLHMGYNLLHCLLESVPRELRLDLVMAARATRLFLAFKIGRG